MKLRSPALEDVAGPALAFATTVALVFALASALGMGEAHAQAVATQPAPASSASPFFSMMQGLVGLVVVVGLIYVAAWLMKKVGPRTRTSAFVHVVGGASVGPREKVVVVKFGDQTLLLGVAPGQVSLLCRADAHDPLFEEPSTSGAAPNFIDKLRAARGGA